MKFSMTGQEKGDLLMQVTAQADLTVHAFIDNGEFDYRKKHVIEDFFSEFFLYNSAKLSPKCLKLILL